MTHPLITFLASFLIWFMFGALLYFWLVGKKITTRGAVHAFIAAGGALVIAEAVKYLFPSSRPFIDQGTIPLTITVPFDGAFPSAHTATSFGMATALWTHDKKIGLGFILTALLVGWGRMLSNVHYFADVFGGAFLGISIAFFIDSLRLSKLTSGLDN